MKHKHHIIPRHRGGTDADGLVDCSVTQHAMFHFCEWKLHGLKEDYIAWKFLSGSHPGGWNKGQKRPEHSEFMTGRKNPEQSVRMMGNKLNTPEVRQKSSDRMKNNNPMSNPQNRQKVSQSRKGKANKVYNYEIVFENKVSIIVTNLKKWAVESGYSYAGLLNVKSGRTPQTKDIVSVKRV